MNEATKAQTKMAELLDKAMLEVLKEGGEPIVDNEGKVQLDGKGRVVRRRVSAATMNAIRARLKDLGINSVPLQGSAAGRLAQEAAKQGMKFDGKPIDPFTTKVPAVDMTADDAATR